MGFFWPFFLKRAPKKHLWVRLLNCPAQESWNYYVCKERTAASLGPLQPLRVPWLHLMELTDHMENYPEEAVKGSCTESYISPNGKLCCLGAENRVKSLQNHLPHSPLPFNFCLLTLYKIARPHVGLRSRVMKGSKSSRDTFRGACSAYISSLGIVPDPGPLA